MTGEQVTWLVFAFVVLWLVFEYLGPKLRCSYCGEYGRP